MFTAAGCCGHLSTRCPLKVNRLALHKALVSLVFETVTKLQQGGGEALLPLQMHKETDPVLW